MPEKEEIELTVARKNFKDKLRAYKETRSPPSKRFKPGAKHTAPPPPPSTLRLPTTPAPVHVLGPQPLRTYPIPIHTLPSLLHPTQPYPTPQGPEGEPEPVPGQDQGTVPVQDQKTGPGARTTPPIPSPPKPNLPHHSPTHKKMEEHLNLYLAEIKRWYLANIRGLEQEQGPPHISPARLNPPYPTPPQPTLIHPSPPRKKKGEYLNLYLAKITERYLAKI